MTPRFAVLSDELLIERFASGQQAAADELFSRYRVVAYHVAHRITGNQADAQDAVQEGFVQAFTHLLDFQRRSSFKTWLLRIVQNAAWLLLRQRKQRPTSIHSAEILNAYDPRTPLEQLIEQELEMSTKELLTAIRRAIKLHATPEMRRVLQLRCEGFTYGKIAEELGCCEKTARSVRKRLRDLVVEELAALGYSLQ